MDFPYGETLTVRSTVTTKDPFGDVTTVVTEESWGPCAVAPRSSEENADSTAPAVIMGLSIYGPPRTFGADDQIVFASGTYAGTWEVEGLPGDWESPFTGWHPGVEVAVKRATGV